MTTTFREPTGERLIDRAQAMLPAPEKPKVVEFKP